MKEYLENAKKYLDLDDQQGFIHACLELRLAIESHVYEKLKFFSKRHGEKLLFKAWQPDKALKILCQLEPVADKSYTLSFAEEDGLGGFKDEFKSLGKHEALSAKWVRKNYNKLGSFLHLRQSSINTKKINKADVELIYNELLRVASGSLITSLGSTLSFGCQLCISKIITCVESIPDLDLVYCPNPECDARYLAELREEKWQFKIDAADFECPNCQNSQPVLTNQLKIDALIKCNQCASSYVISEHKYGFRECQN